MMPDKLDPGPKIPRRKFLRNSAFAVAGFTLGAAGLAACGDATATPAPASTAAGSAATTAAGGATAASGASSTKQFSGELRLLQWVSFVPAADEELKRQADEWGKKNNVKVTIEAIPGNDVQPKTVAAIEAKAGPDIIQMDYNWPWLYETALVDMTKEYNELKTKFGGFFPFLEVNSVVNGTPRALPYCVVPGAWVYRKSWFKDAGFDKFPENWDQFLDAGKKLKAAGHPILQTMGQTFGDSPGMWYSFLWEHGGKEVLEDGKTVAINSPETLAAVEKAVAIYNGAFTPDVLAWDDNSNNKAFLAEQISATLNGASIYLTAKKQNAPFANDLAHALQPAGPQGRAATQLNKTHAVMGYSKNQDAAKEFLMWLMQPDQYNKWLDAGGAYSIYSLKAYENNPVYNKDPNLTIFKDTLSYGRNVGWPGPPSQAASQAFSKYLIVNMFASAAKGKAPKDAITETEAELVKIYGAKK